MAIDFETCEICVPQGQRALAMHEKLWHMFPYDRPVYTEIMEEGKRFYTMTNYAIFDGETFLGNAGLYPVSIWYDGIPLELVGLGAVATVPEYRRQGVAKRLLKYCMEVIDKQQKPSMLFTEEPKVYQNHGYEILAQDYYAVNSEDLNFDIDHFGFEYLETISDEPLGVMADYYECTYPNFNNKVIRSPVRQYYEYYEMMFNPYLKPRIVWNVSDRGRLLGYCRFEVEEDRLTITEFCTAKEATEVIESLLGYTGQFARLTGKNVITLSLSRDHNAWDFLNSRSINTFLEPEGVRRELFMVRPANGGSVESISKLYWSLADKF